MKFRLQIILYLFCASNLLAQNLIPNSSFEDTLLRTTPLYLPSVWINPIQESHDYYTQLHNDYAPEWGSPSNLIGYQVARTGSSFIGIKVYDLYQNTRRSVREYAQVKLQNSLVQDSVYCLQLYMSMADSIVFASRNQLGVYFSSNAIGANNAINLPYTPQIIISPDSFNIDKENWTKYDFQYIATGGEQYMTVGNFNDTTSLDTLFVGGGNQFWMKASYYYFDDFYLGHCDSLPEDTSIGLNENSLLKGISVYPNPFENQLNIRYEGKERIEARMYNVLGEEVLINKTTISSKNTSIHLGTIPSGIYFLRITNGKNTATKKVIKY